MINERSFQSCQASCFGTEDAFRSVHPEFSLSNLPNTIVDVLTGYRQEPRLPENCLGYLGAELESVVCFYIDAFGLSTWERFRDRIELFRLVEEEGVVSALTTQFPSSTVPSVTLMQTMKPVAESGCYEWVMYHPQSGQSIKPFSLVGACGGESITPGGIGPSDIFPKETIFQRLKQLAVRSAFVGEGWMKNDLTSVYLSRGAAFLPFKSLEDLREILPRYLLRENLGYCLVYLDTLDHLGHSLGQGSPKAEHHMLSFFEKLSSLVLALRHPKRLIILMSDHGQVSVNLNRRASGIFINEEVGSLAQSLACGPHGKTIKPCGSCRDMFLYLRSELIEDLEDALRQSLASRAEVYRSEYLIEQGLFGKVPKNSVLRCRLEDSLCILPYRGYGVFWRGYRREELELLGAHGGLSPEEMEVPLLVLR